MLLDAETPRPRAGDRGDPRRRCPSELDGPGEAGADAVGARDRDHALRQTSPRPATQLRELRRDGRARSPSERGLLVGAAGTHPFALWEDQEIVDRPRYRELVDELGYIARAGADLRHPRPRRDRGRRPGDLRRRRRSAATCRCCSRCRPTRPSGAGERTGMMSLADAGLPRLPARRDPAPLRHLGDLLAPGRADDAGRARSRTTPTSGGTCARTRTSARSRCGSSTSRPGSSTRSRSRR